MLSLARVSPFEYLLLFAAVILGLAVSELAIASHRLFNASERVRWDWLSPLAAALVFLQIITQWWSWYSAQTFPGGLRFEMFIGVIVGGVLLFLPAAMVLPEVSHGAGPILLASHYERVRRRFWMVFTLHWVVVTAVSAWAKVALGGAAHVAVPGLPACASDVGARLHPPPLSARCRAPGADRSISRAVLRAATAGDAPGGVAEMPRAAQTRATPADEG